MLSRAGSWQTIVATADARYAAGAVRHEDSFGWEQVVSEQGGEFASLRPRPQMFFPCA